MTERFAFVVLADDRATRQGLIGEHGLSFFIDAGKKKILFDTGQGLVLEKNASFLNVPLEGVTDIVLSHGHYDHTGGLGIALKYAPQAKVWFHPKAVEPKWDVRDGKPAREIGIPKKSLRRLQKAEVTRSPVKSGTKISDEIWISGKISLSNDFEKVEPGFFHDAQGEKTDLLEDDLALVFETAKGLAIVTGCAHAGIVNTLNHIRKNHPGTKIFALVGGFHLLYASSERIALTIQEFKKIGISRLYPGHCTGLSAMAALNHHFQGRCHPLSVGDRFAIPE